MDVKKFVENGDGSADLEVDLTPEEHMAMVRLGILRAVELGMEALGDQPPETTHKQMEG